VATVADARALLTALVDLWYEDDASDEHMYRIGGGFAAARAFLAQPATPVGALDVERITEQWPESISDGLSLACSDCGLVPRFDYHVNADFWREWVPGKSDQLGVVCLPCLDKRCGGVGLAAALEEVQWTGTGHTIVLTPSRSYEYAHLRGER
jgi:hypothetical protein